MDTVCADVEAPTISFIGDNPLVIDAGDAYAPAAVSAVDKYDGAINVKVAGEAAISTQRPGTYRVVYTATDAAGNAVSYERKVLVVDTTSPRITLAGRATLVVEAGVAYDEPGFSAFDIVDGDMTDALIVTAAPPLPVNTRVTGTTTLAYTVTDSTGNTNAASRVVIVQDTTGPVLKLRGQTHMQVEGDSAEDAAWQDPGVLSAEDAVDGDLFSSVTVKVTVSKAAARMEIPTCPAGFSRLNPELVYVAPEFETASVDLAAPAGTLYEITYRVVDQAGNPTAVQRTVEIIDTRPPMLTVTPGLTLSFDMPRQAGQPLQPNSTSVSTGLPVVTSFEQLTITAYDALDGNLAGLVCVATLRDGRPARSSDGDDEGDDGDGRRRRRRDVLMGLDPSAPLGTEYAVTLSVTDFAGRTLEQTISMTVADTQPPYIDLVGGLVYEAQFGPPFKEPGFRAVDGRDGNLNQSVIVVGEVNTRLRSGKDQYLTYTVADDAGNVARVTRVVTLDRGRINLGSTESDSSAGPAGIIVGMILGAVLVLLVLLAVVRRRRRRAQQHKALQAQALAYHGPDNGLGSFTNPAYGWASADMGSVDRPEGQEAQHGMYQPIEAAGQEAERGYLEISEDHGMDAGPDGAMRHNLEVSARGSRSAAYDLAGQRSQGAAIYDEAHGFSSGFGGVYDLASQRSQGAAIYDEARESGGDDSYLSPATADGGYASIGQGKAATAAVYDRAAEGQLDPAYATASDAGRSGEGAFYDIGTSSSGAAMAAYDLAGGKGGESAYDVAHGAEVPRHYLEARPHRGEGGVYDNFANNGASAAEQSEPAYDEPSAMLSQRRGAEYDSASGDGESAYDRATGGGSAPPLYAQARHGAAAGPVYATARPQRNAGMPAAPDSGGGVLEDGTYDNVGQEPPETDYAGAAQKPAYAEAWRGKDPTYDEVRSGDCASPAYDIGNSRGEALYDEGASGEPAYDLGRSEDPTYARSAPLNGGQAGKGDTVYDFATGSGC
jgi:MYXO-CTERM domain-containing protein